MTKNVKEDYYRGEGWPSIPVDLSFFAPRGGSTSIVCEKCNSPVGGLRYVSETDTFIHRELKNCRLTASDR
jgi:hypothetical protein